MIESAVYALYEDDVIQIKNLSIPIDTTELNVALLFKLSLHGFAMGQPCVMDVKVIGDVPDINITEDIGLTLTAQFKNDLRCKRAATETEFSQVMTIITNPGDIEAKIEIEKNLTVKLNITEVKFNIDRIENSTVGDINPTIVKALISLFGPVVKDILNAFLGGTGINLAWILETLLGIDFITFEKTYLEPFDRYLIFKTTPIFNLKDIQKTFDKTFEIMEQSQDLKQMMQKGADQAIV